MTSQLARHEPVCFVPDGAFLPACVLLEAPTHMVTYPADLADTQKLHTGRPRDGQGSMDSEPLTQTIRGISCMQALHCVWQCMENASRGGNTSDIHSATWSRCKLIICTVCQAGQRIQKSHV